MAVTIDDLSTVSAVRQTPEVAARFTADLLAALQRHRVPAIGFVNEGKLYVDGAVDARRVALLLQWIDAGFELGNHTWSHADLHQVPAAQFTWTRSRVITKRSRSGSPGAKLVRRC